MNKKESGAARICNRTSTSVVRPLLVSPDLFLQMPVSTEIRSTLAVHAVKQSSHGDCGPVGKGLTLVGISVNGSGVHPLDGLLLGGGSNARKRYLT